MQANGFTARSLSCRHCSFGQHVPAFLVSRIVQEVVNLAMFAWMNFDSMPGCESEQYVEMWLHISTRTAMPCFDPEPRG